MATQTLTIYADRVQIVDSNAPNTSGTAESISQGSGKSALIHFPFPDNLKYKSVYTLELYLYVDTTQNEYGFAATVRALLDSFDSSVTFNTQPQRSDSGESFGIGSSSPSGYYKTILLSRYHNNKLQISDVLTRGISVVPAASVRPSTISTSISTNAPYIVVTCSEERDNRGSVSGTPTFGYIPKNGETTFRYSYRPPDNIAAGPLSVVSWAFYYQIDSAYYQHVDVGSSGSYTAPSGTFANASVIRWYPQVTLNTGVTEVPYSHETESNLVYQLSTNEPTFTAVAVSPDSSYEDGSGPITFTWTASNSAGTQPSGADLQYSADGGTTWTDLASVTGPALSYTAAANSLPSGQLFWRVRAITNESVAGAWSDPLSFVNVTAPAAPSVNTNAAPFATITWDALGQQASEVVIDGVSYGVRFGAGKSFTLPQPLADGLHTAEVRIQGAYGLWSQFGSTAFTVANAAAGTIDLAGIFGVDAQLQWAADVPGSDFQIYRDGVQIGHAVNSSFTDRRALGTHTWYVLLRQEDGNYTKSNEVTGTLAPEAPVIAPLAGGPWISLRLTESSTTQQTFAYARTHTLRHYSGSPFPVIELTPYEDVSWTFQCAFADANEARSFEALRGQIIILKAFDMVLIGGMMNLNKGRNPFYLAYQFTIEQIAVEEIVDDPNA